MGIVASLPGVAFWAWLHAGARGALLTVGLAAVLLGAGRRWPRLSVVLWAAAAAFWLGHFYAPGPRGLLPTPALDLIPQGRLLLTVSSLAAGVGLTAALLGPAHGLLDRLVGWLRPRLGVVLYASGLGVAGLIALDLYFVNQGRPGFRYETARFHPYLTYHLPGTYFYSHAREGVVRDTRGSPFAQAKPPGIVRVVLNGASTMWGHFQDDDRNPARLLEAALRISDPSRRYEVVMVAVQGKYQLNELIDSVVTLPHWSPDLVVSLNGFNEVWYGEKRESYEGMPSVAGQMEAVLSVPPLASPFYAHTHLGAAMLPKRLSRGPGYVLAEPVRYEAPRYYAYLRRTAVALAEVGIPYAHSFCPSLLEKHRRTATEERMLAPWGRLQATVRRRRALSARIVEETGQITFDAMAAVDTEEQAFGDVCHLDDTGMRRFVDGLARRVPGWLAHRPPSPPRYLPEDSPPLVAGRVDLGGADAEEYLRDGWSGAEGASRWTDGDHAVLRFGADPGAVATLRLKASPFLVEGRLPRQRVAASLNGHRLALVEMAAPAVLSWALPPGALAASNTLRLDLPDAASPLQLGASADPRRLGLAVEWLELAPPAP